jgi:hypothetical protein
MLTRRQRASEFHPVEVDGVSYLDENFENYEAVTLANDFLDRVQYLETQPQTTPESPFEDEKGGNGLGHAFQKQMPSAEPETVLMTQEMIIAEIGQDWDYKREKEV